MEQYFAIDDAFNDYALRRVSVLIITRDERRPAVIIGRRNCGRGSSLLSSRPRDALPAPRVLRASYPPAAPPSGTSSNIAV